MKKLICILSSLLLASTALAGCSGNSSGSSGPTTITIMQSKTEIQTDMQKVVDTYNSSQSKVKVQLLGTSGDNYSTVLQSQFSATPSKAPTIFTISGPSASKFNSYMAPLESTKAAGLILPDFKAEVTTDGKITGLPMAVEGYGLIYNKDLFQKAGVDASSLTTMDALVAACKKLQTVSGVSKALAFAKENYFIFIHPFNYSLAVSSDYANQIKDLDAGKTTFAEIPTVAQYAKDLDALKPYTNKALDSYDDQVAGFANGKYAMIFQGDWAQSVLDQDKLSFDYGMMPLPTSGNTKLAVGLANAWRVNKYASKAQQKGAEDFLDWLITSDKGQDYCADTFGFISAFKDVKDPTSKLAASVASYVKDGNTCPWVFNSDFPNGIDADGAAVMQKYYANNLSGSEMLKELTQAWVQDAKG